MLIVIALFVSLILIVIILPIHKGKCLIYCELEHVNVIYDGIIRKISSYHNAIK